MFRDNKDFTFTEEMQKMLVDYMDTINVQFREPATGIFASLPLLANNINNQNTEKAVDNLHEIYKSTYLILKGISDISVVAKIMSGFEFQKHMIDLSVMLKNLFESAKMILPDYFSVELDLEETCFVEGSHTLLVSAMLNLLLNSFDYRQEDDVRVSITLKRENGRCLLTYKDNSLGIRPEIAYGIYYPFFTANPYGDSGMTNKMGVGLYIVESAIKHAGGTILLQTEFTEGVSFLMSMPDRTTHGGNVFRSPAADLLLDRYSEIFVKLCQYCQLPDL